MESQAMFEKFIVKVSTYELNISASNHIEAMQNAAAMLIAGTVFGFRPFEIFKKINIDEMFTVTNIEDKSIKRFKQSASFQQIRASVGMMFSEIE
jgi:hypothetical protein